MPDALSTGEGSAPAACAIVLLGRAVLVLRHSLRCLVCLVACVSVARAGDYPSADCLNLSFERGGFSWVQAIAPVSSADVWAVGLKSLLHYDGSGWRSAQCFPILGQWEDLELADGRGFAVSSSCDILHVTGSSWSIERLPWSCSLHDVTLVGNTAWAVGSRVSGDSRESLVVFFDGMSWREVDHPAGEALTAIHMTDETSGWAAGDIGLLRWDGDRWAVHAAFRPKYPLRSIHGVVPGVLWAVGGLWRFPPPGVRYAVMYEGGEWTELVDETGTPGAFNEVRAISGDEAWAVADGWLVYRFLAGECRLVFDGLGVSAGESYTAIGVVDSHRVWFGGGRPRLTFYDDGRFRDYAGDRLWSRLGVDASGASLLQVSMADRNEGVAVGPCGPPLQRTAEGTWRELEAPSELYVALAVEALSADDVWFSSVPSRNVSVVWNYGSGRWRRWVLPTVLPVWDLGVDSEGRVWAAAGTESRSGEEAAGALLVLQGGVWSVVWAAEGVPLRAVAPVAAGCVIGAGRRLVRWCPNDWEYLEPDGAPPFFTDVRMSGDGVVTAAGGHSVLRYTAGAWSDLDFVGRRAQSFVEGLAVSDCGDVWVVDGQDVWYWRGGAWDLVEVPYDTAAFGPDLWDVVVVDNDDGYSVWAVGDWDTVVRMEQNDLPEATPATPDAFTATPGLLPGTPTPGIAWLARLPLVAR